MAKRPYARRGASLEEKLAYYSEPRIPGRCQLWLGGTFKGYGILNWQGRCTLAHRATWMCERGPIPEGLHVLHHCDNPPCRNIEHLFLGTNYDNIVDKVAKGRQGRGGGSTPGEGNGNAKLTDEIVLEIRAIPHDVPQDVIGAMYGVHQVTVSKIRLRQRWTHL